MVKCSKEVAQALLPVRLRKHLAGFAGRKREYNTLHRQECLCYWSLRAVMVSWTMSEVTLAG